MLANFIGNSIVYAVIIRNKFLRTPVNYLPNDFAPYLYTHPGGTLGDWFCKTITGENMQLPRGNRVVCLHCHSVSCYLGELLLPLQ